MASGQFEQLYPNVVRLWGSPETFPQRALAAVWAAGGDAMSSHRTSARLWGVQRTDADPLDVLLPSRARHALPRGVTIHRPRDLLDLRPIIRQKVPTTNPLRMLLDLGAIDPDAVLDAMVLVMTTKVASPAAIRAALLRHARQGRAGITPLRTALESWLDDELPPDSELERQMAVLINRYRLPPVEFHAVRASYEVDFAVTFSLHELTQIESRKPGRIRPRSKNGTIQPQKPRGGAPGLDRLSDGAGQPPLLAL